MIASLRRHYGEDVDIAPSPTEVLALARASFAEIPAADSMRMQQTLPRRFGRRALGVSRTIWATL
jgi:hypothetical protein